MQVDEQINIEIKIKELDQARLLDGQIYPKKKTKMLIKIWTPQIPNTI